MDVKGILCESCGDLCGEKADCKVWTYKGAEYIEPPLRDSARKLDKDVVAITYCSKGVTVNAAQNILLGRGFTKVFNLSGGQKQYFITHSKR